MSTADNHIYNRACCPTGAKPTRLWCWSPSVAEPTLAMTLEAGTRKTGDDDSKDPVPRLPARFIGSHYGACRPKDRIYELQFVDCQDGVAVSWTKLLGFTQSCRFRNCRDYGEPKCAVQSEANSTAAAELPQASTGRTVRHFANVGRSHVNLASSTNQFKLRTLPSGPGSSLGKYEPSGLSFTSRSAL